MSDRMTPADVKADREAGTRGRWEWVYSDGPQWRLGPGVLIVEGGTTDGTPDGDAIDRANARRIARVPDLEDAYLAHTARIAALEAEHDAILASAAEVAADPAPWSDMTLLIEALTDGVPCLGMHEDNETELFNIDGANDTMAEAAAALKAATERAERAEARAERLRAVLDSAARDIKSEYFMTVEFEIDRALAEDTP